MKLKPLLILLSFLIGMNSFAQTGYTHIELQGGYELFPDMSNKSGIGFNVGARYAFTEKYFVATLLHCGINNGSYEGMYAGETTKLDHTLREYMIGAGPGIYLYNGGNKWIYTDILVGYGFGEELKSSENSSSKSLNSLAVTVQTGAEYQLNNGWIIGANIGGYLVGGKIRPAICLKWGVLITL
ncbi:MAG: outer membrane beta-barrel protein [Prevotellaceae bacterium]|nr:outer membrane beta-barrel protein [Prevotellaceae bacterium]